jgi:hypothetical protein
MRQSSRRRSFTPSQIELVEHALRQLTKLPRAGWDSIPIQLKPFFETYMEREVWAGLPDLSTLRAAALMLLRDAITGTGVFAVEERPTCAAGAQMPT